MIKKFTEWTLEDRQFIREVSFNCYKLENCYTDSSKEVKKTKHKIGQFDNSIFKFYTKNKKLFTEGEHFSTGKTLQIFSPISAAIPNERSQIKSIPCLTGGWFVSYLPFAQHWERPRYKRSTWGGACLIVNENIKYKQLDELEWIVYCVPVNGMLGVYNPEGVGDISKLPKDMKYKIPPGVTSSEQKWVYNIQNTFVENPGLGLIVTSHMCVFQTPDKNPRYYYLGIRNNEACAILFPSLF